MTTGAATDVQAPRVTPYLLHRADDMCPRRLDHEYRSEAGSDDPVNRARIRGAFLDAARTAHARAPRLPPAPWRPPGTLTPEEDAVFEQAVHWYCRFFADREVHLVDHGLDRPSTVEGFDTRLGGWVDLTVIGTDGTRELRFLDFWGREAPAEVLDGWAVRLALLRLGDRHGNWRGDWLGSSPGDGPLVVSWTDLLHGVRREQRIDPAATRAAAHEAVTDRIAVVAARADPGAHTAGSDCLQCRFHKGCPEFPQAMLVRTRRAEVLPAVLPLTPTALETWLTCRRAWRTRDVLAVPASDEGAPGAHGREVHALLRLLHHDGPCDDPARIDDLVTAHGASPRVRQDLGAHASRCPAGAEPYGHEFTRNRLWPRRPCFLASARIDAAWIHGGVLDVRDYKTGGAWYTRVADDPRARLQAWVMAPVAAELGLRLRLRYEHLGAEVDDDPDPWEPDTDDLGAVQSELVAVVTEMRAEREWSGVADPVVCGRCRHRSICPDSAAPSMPGWPRVADDPDGHGRT